MRRGVVGASVLVVFTLMGKVVLGEDLAIAHSGVGCIVAEQHPVVTAGLAPAAQVARARVYFRAHSTPHWYFVEMQPAAGSFQGTLPRPKSSTKQIDYYIEAIDQAFVSHRTAEFAPVVVAGAASCKSDLPTAATAPAARVLVGAPAGAPAVPVGFASTGVVSVAASAATATTGATGGGAGISAGLIVGGVAVAGAGTAAVLVATKGDDAPACGAHPNEFYELALVCGSLCASARVGCPMTVQVGVGRWPTIDELNRALAGQAGIILADGVPLPVTYEGATWHEGGGPAGYGNRARAVWTPTAGPHALTGYWTLYPNDVSRCDCTAVQ